MKTVTINLIQPRIADTGKSKTSRIYGIFKNRNLGNWLQLSYTLGSTRVYDGGESDAEVKVIFTHPAIMWGDQAETEADFLKAAEKEILWSQKN